MSTVRPPLWPQATTTPVNRAAPQAAAQRAFFDAAMGRAGAPAPPRPVAPVQARPQAEAQAAPMRQVVPQPQALGEAPQKILRPGSLLDIRV